MIKAVIFDCFGVLAEDGWLPIKRKYLSNNKAVADEITDLGKQNEFGMLSNDELTTRMAGLMGIERKELEAALGKRVPNLELFEFVESKLKPKYKIGLLSNANYNVMKDLFTPEQARVFDANVLSFESHLIKPDKRMFELMAERLGVEMYECIFVDDVERYAEAAEDYGMTAVWYQSLEQAISRIEAALD